VFSCWNLNTYWLAVLILAGVIALGFHWGFGRAARKYRRALKLAEQKTQVVRRKTV
jgi:hypothetical protein